MEEGVVMLIPMNAKLCPPDKVTQILGDPNYVLETKVDGYRAVWEDGAFHSRLGNPFELPQLGKYLCKDVTLDGEIYVPGGTSNDVTTALGKDGDKSKLRYMVFDRLDNGNMERAWTHRRQALDDYSAGYGVMDFPIDFSVAYPEKHALHTLDDAMKYIEVHDIEGFMLKNINGLYCPDQRPVNNWWKIKKHITADVVTMGFIEGKGKYKGLIGSITFGLYKEGELTAAGSCGGFTDELRTAISCNQKDYIGRVMEIAAMQRTKDGMFRHPAFKGFREDKTPLQCQWNQD